MHTDFEVNRVSGCCLDYSLHMPNFSKDLFAIFYSLRVMCAANIYDIAREFVHKLLAVLLPASNQM